jgi:hypothetical protein
VHGHLDRALVGEPVEFRHHERVAGPDCRECVVESGAFAVLYWSGRGRRRDGFRGAPACPGRWRVAVSFWASVE